MSEGGNGKQKGELRILTPQGRLQQLAAATKDAGETLAILETTGDKTANREMLATILRMQNAIAQVLLSMEYERSHPEVRNGGIAVPRIIPPEGFMRRS